MTREEILKYFNYDRDFGVLIWKYHWNKTKMTKLKGSIITSSNKKGYINVMLEGKQYKVHRLIWVIENNYQPEEIDHIDGNVKNNKIENLRSVDRRGNNQNRKTHRQGRLVGTHWYSKLGKWGAKITINRKSKHIGLYSTELDAHTAYLEEIKKLYIGGTP